MSEMPAALKELVMAMSGCDGDCDNCSVGEEADRDDELYGDWIDERCPKCGANLLGNKVGDKWCSLDGMECE